MLSLSHEHVYKATEPAWAIYQSWEGGWMGEKRLQSLLMHEVLMVISSVSPVLLQQVLSALR